MDFFSEPARQMGDQDGATQVHVGSTRIARSIGKREVDIRAWQSEEMKMIPLMMENVKLMKTVLAFLLVLCGVCVVHLMNS
jgi:hypothetical protein